MEKIFATTIHLHYLILYDSIKKEEAGKTQPLLFYFYASATAGAFLNKP